jgi:O-antigen/teichoic acid export membrane protein
MQKLFLKGLGITLLLNLLVKPATIFVVDIKMQNELGSETYGIFQTILNISFIFSMVLDMGMSNFMTRLIAQYPHLRVKYSNRLLTYRLILTMSYLIITSALFFFVGIPLKYWWILALLMLHQISIISVLYVRAFTAGLMKFKVDAFLSVVERSVYFILGLVLLKSMLFGKVSLESYIIIFVSSSFFSLLCALVVYIKYVSFPKFEWDKKFFQFTIRKTILYATLVIIMMMMSKLDVIFIKLFTSTDKGGFYQAGIYNGSYRLLDACWMFSVLFGIILLPIFSRLLKDKESTQSVLTSSFNLLISAGIAMAALSIGLRKEFFAALYGESGDSMALTWIFHALAFIPMCMTVVFGTLLTANGSLKRLNTYALISLGLMVVSNCIFVPLWGAMGAALSFFVGQSVLGITQYLDVQFSMKHKMAPNTWLKIGVLSLVLGILYVYHSYYSLSVLVYAGSLIGLWTVLVFGLRIIDLKQILKSFMGK